MEIVLTINETYYKVNSRDVHVDTTLNTFIRQNAQLTGTKYMCLEGGCGACVVTVTRANPATLKDESFAVNSCLKSLFACHNYHVTTIEGLDDPKTGPHPLQRRIVQLNGSQCGYCTGGMVMNMHGLMAQNADRSLTMMDVEKSFGGNICRCTGYRPILDTFKSFASDATEAMVRACQDPDLVEMDIEDLTRFCPKRGAPCAGKCRADDRNLLGNEPMSMVFDGPDSWYRATKLTDIFDAWKRIPAGTPSMLVAGNTARGITRLSPDLHTFIDINPVAELYTTKQTSQYLSIGALTSLTESIRMLRQAVKTPCFEYCNDLADHFELIANNPVRNVASIAGNLGYKHAHHEFPSDVFLSLDTCDASLTIVDANNVRSMVRMGEFLKLDMSRKLILNVVLPKLDLKAAFRTYKVMIRAQNAHAYVNAGFYVRQDNGKVTYARICYGGIQPEFVHARATEALLIGRDLYNNETLQAALASLDVELQPDWVLPDAQPAYRKILAKALFYRFVMRTAPTRKLSNLNRSGAVAIERPLSSGTQDYNEIKANFPLTEPLDKYEGMEQATGQAKYVNDLAPMKGELWAAVATATKVHAKVATIDASAALALPGVVSFHTLADIPGANDFTQPTVFTVFPEPILVGLNEVVLYNGQPLGVLCAIDQQLAQRAVKLVKVTYMNSVDGVDDPESNGGVYSLARTFLTPLIGAPAEKPVIATLRAAHGQLNGQRIRRDIAPLVARRRGVNATQQIGGRFEIGGQFHYTMETHTCVCVPVEKGMDVYCSTQWIELTQMAIATMLKIHEHEINMRVVRVGGAFGVKITRATQFACIAALPCFLLNRPVRLVLPLEQSMQSVGKRFGLLADYTLAVDEVGEIQSLKTDFTQDAGCSYNEAVSGITIATMPNVYKVDTWTLSGGDVLTDAPSNTFFRCPGTLEGIATTENIMDHIRWTTGLDELAVRLANIAPDHPMRKMSADFVQETAYAARKSAVDAFNAANKWRKRGIALVPMQWPVEFYGALSAYVAVYHRDGSVVVKHGGIECGQGINTKVAQVVAYTLGVPMELVSVKYTDNVSTANSIATGGSVTSESACYAVKKSCEQLLERMKPVREGLAPGYSWSQLTHACHEQQIDLREMYLFRTTEIPKYDIYGITSCEVEVDLLTGCYQLNSVHLWEDVGESINPKLDVGQVEGAFIMGLGYWLSEKLIYNGPTGELLTNSTWTYKPPGARDIPVDFNVKFVKNSPNPTQGFLRSKAVGEPAVAMSIVAIFALRYAINAFRQASGKTGDMWFAMSSGTTPEEVFIKSEIDSAAFTL